MQIVISLLQQAVGYLITLLGLSHGTAQETTPYRIQIDVRNISDTIHDINWGNNALHNQLTALAAAVAAIPRSSGPVVLPTIPPAGYGSPDEAFIADAVWNTPLTVFPATAGDALRETARHSNPSDNWDSPFKAGIFAVSGQSYGGEGIYTEALSYPVFDPTHILPADTLLGYLTRENPTWTVTVPWSPQTFVGLRDPTTPGSVTYTTTIDEVDFAIYKKALLASFSTVPPVWPGLLDVLMGTAVALDVGVTVPGPMDGVLIDISSVPTKQGYFQFDTVRAWRNVGAVAFTSDNGDEEAAQTLAFDHAVYCPRTLVQASSAVLRCSPGVTGTVTPWVRRGS